jgi:hypothetical protein
VWCRRESDPNKRSRLQTYILESLLYEDLSAIGRAFENDDTTGDTMSAEDADNRLRGLTLISRSSEGSLGPDMEAGLKIKC